MNLDAVIVALAVGLAVVAVPVIMMTLLALLGERGRHRADDNQGDLDDDDQGDVDD